MDKVDLEIDKVRWTFYINPQSKDIFIPTSDQEDSKEFPIEWIATEKTKEAFMPKDTAKVNYCKVTDAEEGENLSEETAKM